MAFTRSAKETSSHHLTKGLFLACHAQGISHNLKTVRLIVVCEVHRRCAERGRPSATRSGGGHGAWAASSAVDLCPPRCPCHLVLFTTASLHFARPGECPVFSAPCVVRPMCFLYKRWLRV